MDNLNIKYIRIKSNVFNVNKILSVKKGQDVSLFGQGTFYMEIQYCGKWNPMSSGDINQKSIEYKFYYGSDEILNKKIDRVVKILKERRDLLVI